MSKEYHTKFIKNSLVNSLSSSGKKHIAVIGGGMSAEREVSLVSASGVCEALVADGYKVTSIDMGSDIASVLASVTPDVVFNALHGTYGEDGCLPGLLNIMRIPYTHSGVAASAIGFNKIRSRDVFISNGIKIAHSIIVNKSDHFNADPMQRPYVIKPIDQGSSIGVNVVFEEDEFDFAKYDFPYGDRVIVEQYIKGKELQVAVLDGKSLGVLEIKLLKRRFYDYDTKYTEGLAEHIYPANVSEEVYNMALREAERAFNAIGCRGLARAEFIYSESDGAIYMLEINTHPGMTPLSICPEIAAKSGIDFTSLLNILIETANFEQ